MIELKNNYLRPSGSGKNFRVDIDSPENKNPNFLEECKQIALEVESTKQGKLYMMYSGGVDSEFVLNVFLMLGIEITPIIIKLNPGYNEHDVKYAFDFCSSKNLKPQVIDIDFDNFVKSGLISDIGKKYKLAAYQLPSTLHVLNSLDGTLVMGNHSVPHIAKDEETGVWFVDEYETIWRCLEYFRQNNLYGCPFFLAYTAEQYLAYMQSPIMLALANNKIPGKLGSNSSKWRILNSLAPFDMEERPKFTGFENIENSPIFQHENLQIFKKFGKKWGGIYREPYFELLARLES
jgi:hypothetical protein